METTRVGIDVSAKSLDVRTQDRRDAPRRALKFDNTSADHQKLIKRLTKRGRSARVVVEACGTFHLDLALAFHRAPRIEVMVVNPRAARDFAQALMRRSKTDGTDAEDLLEFNWRMEFIPWQPPPQQMWELRALTRRMVAVASQIAREKNRLHAQKHQRASGAVRQDLEVSIRFHQRRIQRLEEQALNLVRQHPDLQEALAHLTSIKGIAQTSGLQILGEIAMLDRQMTPRQVVAHTGLDPRHFESGTSVSRPTRISKVGNSHLRAALFLPAMTARRFDPNVRAFYEKLLERGKLPMQAVVAVMRKLLHSIWAMLKYGVDFDGEKFHALEARKA
jgi:transposase